MEMGNLGIGEVLVIALLVFIVPMGVLFRVASARGQSARFSLWGLLSYAGLIIGLLIMLAMPRSTKKGTPSAF